MAIKDFFIRNLDADNYLENFLVASVVSLFIIRIFLRLTHYPHLGGHEFHIAHMLWGGIFMLAAIIILLSFISKTTMHVASIIGGIGFGTFIDELGKFITNDNNYFFRPTIAFIYIIFVLIYLLLKFLPQYKRSQKEYLVNAIDMIKESAVNDFDEEEERKAYEYLRQCDPNDPIVQALTKLLSRITAQPNQPPNLFSRLRNVIRGWYYVVAKSDLIIKVIIFYLVFQTADTIINTAILYLVRSILPFDEWGKLYASGLAGIFVLFGLLALRFSKIEAYRFFRISILISILLTQFFSFMRGGWIELIPLTANIFTYTIINYATHREKEKNKAKLSQLVQILPHEH